MGRIYAAWRWAGADRQREVAQNPRRALRALAAVEDGKAGDPEAGSVLARLEAELEILTRAGWRARHLYCQHLGGGGGLGGYPALVATWAAAREAFARLTEALSEGQLPRLPAVEVDEVLSPAGAAVGDSPQERRDA